MSSLFKAYDIRGLYPEDIDAPQVRRIAHAFVRYLQTLPSAAGTFSRFSKLVVAHDMRTSSPALNAAFHDGAQAAGAEVTDIGLATTPMLYTALIDGSYDGGVMLTASHLPARYNGIKLCREQAIPLSGADGLPQVEALYRDTTEILAGGAAAADHAVQPFLDHYLQRLRSFIAPDIKLRCVVDAGNGMGGLDTPAVFRHLPHAMLIPLYMEPDGNFPHHVPNPAEEKNTRELQDLVIARGADLGIAFDGDADRTGFIDERGMRVPADLMIAVLAEHFLAQHTGATVLYDLRASRAVPERIRELGGRAVETRVGHSFIKKTMRETGAVFAGELSGHYYFREAGFIDSGILAMLTLLNLLTAKRQTLSELTRPLERYARSGEINIVSTESTMVIDKLTLHFADGEQSTLDGLTVRYPDWWFNLRPSHTEALLRLVIEADDADLLQRRRTELLERVSSAMTSALHTV
jgi:phosphomannomutase